MTNQNSSAKVDVQLLEVWLVFAEIDDGILSDAGAITDVQLTQTQVGDLAQADDGNRVQGGALEAERLYLIRFRSNDRLDATNSQSAR